MRIFCVAVPAAGHVNPLLPLVGALVDQGHDVLFATGEDPGGAVARSGATYVCAGRTEREWYEVLCSRVRGQPGDGLAPERINHYFVPRLFADIGAADMIDDVVQIGGSFSPDLVLFEAYAFAGPLAARVLGVPAVQHLISPMMPHEVCQLADDAVSPLWRAFGHSSPGWAGVYEGLTIEVSPPSLERRRVPAGEQVLLRPAPLPMRPVAPSEPPVVYVTLGTFFANPAVFRSILDGLDAEELEIVVTVGADNDPASIGPVKASVRVERYVPQYELLPRCSVVVHHGGSGTMFGALAHGLPQVVVPQGADNFLNGELVEQCGAGLSILPDSLDPAEVRRCVRAVLDDPSYATSAKQLGAEVAAMADAGQVAADLAARYSA